MGAAYFYHLTDSTLEQTLPMLLEKARGAGWRIMVRAPADDLVDRLDQVLWTIRPDSFLPHGVAGGPHDADQPILLGVDVPSKGFECLMSVEGALLTPEEVSLSQRSCILFNGHDPAAVSVARERWKALTDQGIEAQYWAQEDGRWTKKAESDPAAKS